MAPRIETERLVLAANSAEARTIIIRPACVYGGAGSLTAPWFESAEKEGAARIVGDGSFHWAMVHLEDLAELYRLAAESTLSGEILNAVEGSKASVRECAEAVSLAVTGAASVVSTPLAEAEKVMGPMAGCLTLHQRLDASKAARLLGWYPRHTAFTDHAARYYRSWKATH